MERARTAKATYDVIEQLALKSFDKFEITERYRHEYKGPRAIAGTWRVGAPDSGFHAFVLHVDLGVITIWGDLGEFVIRCSDANSLRWLLFCGTSEDCKDGGPYCDYLLGKVTASGEARRDFMIDDAREYLRTWEIETKNDAVDEDGEVDQHTQHTLDRIAEVRVALDDVQYDAPSHQQHMWFEAMSNIDHDDPPRCEGWSPSMLWLWQAVKVFRRLFVAKYATDANVVSVADQKVVVG